MERVVREAVQFWRSLALEFKQPRGYVFRFEFPSSYSFAIVESEESVSKEMSKWERWRLERPGRFTGLLVRDLSNPTLSLKALVFGEPEQGLASAAAIQRIVGERFDTNRLEVKFS